MDERHTADEDDSDDDGRPLTRAENRLTRKMLAQNAAASLAMGYMGKVILAVTGLVAIVVGYLQIKGGHL